MKLDDLSTVQTILNEISNNKFIIENINHDFYIYVDKDLSRFEPERVFVLDSIKSGIVKMLEKRNRYLIDELKELGVEV